jgi:hypothetical protein
MRPVSVVVSPQTLFTSSLAGLIGFSAMCYAGGAHAAIDCASFKPLSPSTGNTLQILPIAEELAAPNRQLGTGVGFAELLSAGTTVEVVLSRIQHQECRATTAASKPLSGAAGAYQPKPGEATAWRFDMTQNGKRMTADEFDAWMKARGVRVVKGPAAVAAPPPPPPAPAPEPPKKKKR